MATDNTHLPETTTSTASDHQEFNPEVVQVAAADPVPGTPPAPGQAAPVIPGVPNGEVTVTVPAGQTIVRVQVAPGETIDLPFDTDLAAKFGQQGNLAIKVGDQTIILVGYAEANQQAGVTVKDSHGHAIDVATVVAATDPNLDIQTAAGGAAAGQGGQGGHLFFNFGNNHNLSGFGELGPIDQTALNYQLISPDEKILLQGVAPVIISISVDNNGTVNEDDFHHSHSGGENGVVAEALVFGGDENGASAGLQDQLQNSGTFTNVFFGNYQDGNDPYDTKDHEDGSQSTPPLSDDNNGIDQDREPLSTTAHVVVNFQNSVGGTLTFDHAGITPIITNLQAMHLTSHDNALSYALLPATATHGESIVGYYNTEGGQVVVFSLEIEQASGPQNSTFDIDFTIYGTLDNPVHGAGVLGEDSFDLNTIFYANASDSTLFTQSAPGALVFHDIDDVPELGYYSYSTGDGEGSGSPVSGVDTAVFYNPANLTIGLDETPHAQHTSYDRDTSVLGDIDPTHALGQSVGQTTDDVGHTYTQFLAGNVQTTINAILAQPADSTNADLTYQQGVLAHLGLQPGQTFTTHAMGAASSYLDVSFGADGAAQGSADGTQDKEAGPTLFAHDGNATATAFQLYMQVGANPDGHPIDSHLTNVFIDVDNGDGTFTKEQVTAYQLDANTIIGIAPAPEGKPVETDEIQSEVALQAGGIPVFEIHIDPNTGELTLVQYHSVDNPDSTNPNDPLAIQTDDGQPLVQFRGTDFDGDYVDAPLEVAIIDDAPVICKVTYCSTGTSDHSQGYVDEDYLTSGTNNGVPGNHDHDTSPDNHNSPYGTDGHNDGDGPGGTHVTGQIQVQNEVDTPLNFTFNVAGLSKAGDTVASFLDADGHTVTSSDGHNIALTLTQVGSEWVVTGSYTDAASVVHDVFTVSLDSLSGNFTFDLQGALGHPDHGPGPITSYEDNLNLSFGAQVTDSDGDPATTTLQFVVDDDQPAIVCQPVIDCTISSDPNPRGAGECLSESTHSVTVDINNKPSWVTTSATDDKGLAGSVGTSTGAGFGVDSDTDGKGQDRFHEINYDDHGGTSHTGGSESLTFSFGGHLVESATVELARFYSGENGVGDEQGHWAAYKGGVLVAEGDFTASSATGQFGLAIPTVAGGFDSVVFTATPGTHLSGQSGDESDYLVQQMELNLLPTDKQEGHFTYEFGADGGIEPSGNAATEAGLGFQAHYTGATLTSDGLAVTVTESVVNGHIIIEGTVAGPGGTTLPVFTMDVDPGTPSTSTGIATASYTYEQYAPLDNNHAGTNLPFQFVITDRDGDATSTEVCVCLKDAAPIIGNTTAVVYEEGLQHSQGAAHDGTDAGDGKTLATGFLNFSYNGDGPGHITALSSTNGDGATVTHVGDIWTVHTSNYTLTVDDTTGYYTFNLLQAYTNQNSSPDSFDNVLGHFGSTSGADLLKALGFSFTVADADGTTANGTLNVNVHDDGPVVTACWNDDSRTLLETADANTIGNNSDSDSANFGALFSTNVNYGADGAGHTSTSFAMSFIGTTHNGSDSGLTSDGHHIYLYNIGGVITGSTSTDLAHVTLGNSIFSLSTNSTGVVTLTQYQELDHPLPGSSSNYDHQTISLGNGLVGLTGTVTATDSDGDSASSSQTLDLGGNVKFEDDGPSVTVTVSSDADIVLLTHDAKTIGNPGFDTATANFSGLFHVTPDYGADTPGSISPTTYALSFIGATHNGSDSGLDSDAHSIYLFNVGGTVYGTTSSTGQIDSSHVIFTLSSDSTGHVTLTQYQEIDHPTPGVSSNYDSQTIALANGLVGLTGSATATDFDGDTATGSKTVDLGGNVKFADDGPSISISLSDDSAIVLLTHDAKTIGNPGFDTSTADFSGVFHVTPTYGADTPGTTSPTTYALSFIGATHNGSDSGLDSDAHSIYLFNVGGTVYGTTSSTGQIDSSHVIFTLSSDSTGHVTLTQYQEIDHPTPGVSSNYDSQTIALANGLVGLTASATATDFDKDTASASQTVDLGGNVKFADDGPSISISLSDDSAIVLLTHDAKTIGNPGFDTSTADFSGVFHVTPTYGADTPGTTSPTTYALSFIGATHNGSDSGLDSDGNSIFLYNIGGTVYGTTSSTGQIDSSHVIFTLSSDSSGHVTLTQYQEIDHPTPGVSSNYDSQTIALANGLVGLTGSATATDFDKDTASASQTVDLGGNVKFADDGPSISISLSDDSAIVLLTHDAKTIGNPGFDTSTADFSGVFHVTPTYGADTPGTTSPTTYALSFIGATHNGSDSGLDSDAHSIYLFNVGGTVYGTTSSTGQIDSSHVIFTLSSDSTGHVTLTQYQEIDHPTPGVSSNYDSQTIALANGLVGLTASATATDFDKDTASASQTVDLGGNVKFADDGPSISISLSDDSAIVLLTHDAKTIGNPGFDTSTADFSGVFHVTPTYGADTPGTTSPTTYALSFIGATHNGSDSGLDSDGNSIFLYNIGGTVYGTTSSTGQIDSSHVIFTLSSDSSGHVTLTQYQEIDHPTPGVSSNFDSQTIALANGLVGLTGSATATDFDKDTASASQTVDLGGNVKFADDGPTANPDTGAVVILNVALFGNVLNNDSVGADAITGYSHGKVLTYTVGANTYAADGSPHTIAGVGTIAMDDHGNYTFTQTNSSSTASLTINYTMEDFDQDTASSHLDISLKTGQPPSFTTSTVTVDEDGLPGGNNPNTTTVQGAGDLVGGHVSGGTPSPASEAIWHDTFTVNWNNDTTNQAITFNKDTLATLKGLDGNPLDISGDGTGDLIGKNHTTGQTVIEIKAGDASTGEYTVTLYQPVQQPTSSTTEDSVSANVMVNVTNGSGTTSHEMTITINDDVPTITGLGTPGGLTVDETNLHVSSSAINVSGLFTPHFGADGQASSNALVYALTNSSGGAINGVDSHLTTTAGGEIYLFTVGGNIEGHVTNDVNGLLAFTVSISGSSITLNQNMALHHTDPNSPNEADTLNGIVFVTATATDGDGDHASATLPAGLLLSFLDDAPTAAISAVANTHVTIDESAGLQADDKGTASPFSYGTPLAWGSNGTAVVSTAGSAYGADGAGTTVLALKPSSAGVDFGLIDTATGQHIYLYQGVNAGEVIGRVGSGGAANAAGAIDIAVSINSDGSLNVAEFHAIHQPNASDPNDGVSITDAALVATVTVTDGDGDHSTATANIGSHVTFLDDGPVAVDDGNFTVSALNQNTTPELSFAAHSGHGLLDNDTVGADGAHITSVHSSVDNADHAVGVAFDVDGGHLTVNADGSWTYDQTTPITSTTVDTFTYTLTDGDGDTSTATFTITPLVSHNVPDAEPDAVSLPSSVAGVAAQNNVLLVLDLSTSMDETVAGTGGQNRLQVEQAALVHLLQQYEAQPGNVSLQIETFGITAATNGTVYSSNGAAGHTLADAIAYVNGFTTGNLSSGTNYDAAIGGPAADSQSNVAGSAYNIVSNWPASSSTVSNTVYFISDGLPQSGSGTGAGAGASYLISSGQQADWDSLLGSKGATAYAIGIDLGTNPTTFLAQVADPSDASHVITTGSVDLGTTLTGTTPVSSSTTGNVLTNDHDGGDGYHSPAITQFVHNGHTYAWNGAAFTVDGSTTLGATVTAHNNGTTDISIQTQDGGVFELNFGTGAFHYTAPATSVSETETFTYTIEDNLGNDTSTATLTVHVLAAPVITSGGSGTEAENTVTGNVVYQTTATDGDGHTLTYSITGADAALFNINATTGAVTFKASPNYENPQDAGADNVYNIVVDAHDGVNNTDATQAVAITVTNVNEAPVITSGTTGTEAENTAITNVVYQTTATDPEGNGLTYSLTGTDASLFNVSSTGAVTFKASPNFEAPTDSGANNVYDIVVNVKDGTNTTTQNVAITVTNVNEAPVNTMPAAFTVIDAGTKAITSGLSVADPDNAKVATTQNLTVTVAVDNGSLNFGSTTGLHLDSASWAGASITFDGTQGQIDAALATLVYTAPSGLAHSTDTLHVTTTDGSLSDSDTTAITLQHTVLGATDSVTAPSYTTLNVTANYSDGGGTSHHVVDTTTSGTTGHSLTGSSGHSDYLDGGAGNDALHAGSHGDYMVGGTGTDTYDGGTGNDVMILDSSDLQSATRHIAGGAGDDMIDMHGLTWNFVGSGTNSGHNGITGVEVINLEGANTSNVTLDAASVLDMSGNNGTLVIRGDTSGDTVNLQHTAGDGNWTSAGTQVAGTDGRSYDVYTATHGVNTATVWVDHDMTTNVHVNT